MQSALFLAGGRYALIPALAIVLYRSLDTYAMSKGWKHNIYMDGILQKKFSAQFPNELGEYGNKPADSEVVVFLIGTRCNHPLGLFAPGFKELGGYFPSMVKDLEKHADEFDFLGMTSWHNLGDRSTNAEIMSVGYFKSVEGLHNFAHSTYHREGWDWWNKNVKQYPHLSIFHETYQVPKGHWENIYVNSHTSGITSTTFKVTDEMTGKEVFASPIVDASKGLLKTSAGRMSRSKGDENDKYGEDPY